MKMMCKFRENYEEVLANYEEILVKLWGNFGKIMREFRKTWENYKKISRSYEESKENFKKIMRQFRKSKENYEEILKKLRENFGTVIRKFGKIMRKLWTSYGEI